ncbi:MAG: SAM-dependent methyltransferase [Acetobacter sp.]|uniref:hypothetical protein n=2 Tax=Acetobacteraceae TaxID=433 RepID=UPI0039E8264B
MGYVSLACFFMPSVDVGHGKSYAMPKDGNSATKMASILVREEMVCMQADFLDAHERHWSDAEHLFQAQRWANADHLYGMAAECGLKLLMIALGMAYDEMHNRPTKHEDRVHANKVWLRYESYRSGNVSAIGLALSAQNPFADWDVSDRYAAQRNFNRSYVLPHQRGAQAVCDLLKEARREGILG